ncbi:sensor histidine kinase [Gorillibacterium massiliense]|uniref:sensor histidine kinase n=1 Tax=Gorillibacterium massiliense TaxID=1280390 RepID=UPI0004B8873A|nr:HAMP domain-containing sensor histidine kinase [Gorillibacterium massiliense]
MVRNREMLWQLLLSIILVILGAAAGYSYQTNATLLVVLLGMLLTVLHLLFSWRRYKAIRKLSYDLRVIRAGNYSLDIRDNREGELSILKSEIYKMTLTLSEQAELLKKDKKYLADALSDISHQLKTPLTSMLVMTDLLGNPQLTEDKRREFLRSIRAQLDRIEWLVTSLLKLSKIDAGTIPFKKERHRIVELVDKATAPLLIPMELKEQKLNIQGDAEAAFTGDLNWTAEALINLLKNGVEHTAPGGEIAIRYSENPLYSEIHIADNGGGIDPEDLPHIFERFYKGKSAAPDSVGIGLAMARTILVNQQAELTVKSEQGKGTAFTVRFYKQIGQ